MSRRVLALFASLFLVGGLLATSASAVLAASCGSAGSTCYVSSVNGNDAFDGNTPATAKATIQAASTAAGLNGTVIVAAGTYGYTNITQNGQTLTGPHAGECRQDGPVAGQAVIVANNSATGSIDINADNVTLDGFEVTSLGTTTSGVWTSSTASGYRVQNNLIVGNAIGIYANSDGASWITCNEIRDNLNPGSSGGAGIYGDGGDVNLTIDNNELRGHANNNPIILVTSGPQSHIGLVLSNNDIHDNPCNCSGVYLLKVIDGHIFGNDITSVPAPGSADIRFGGANVDVDVDHNILHLGQWGVYVVDDGYGFGLNADIHVNRNSLTNHSDSGVDNDGGQTTTVDAECNWWGAAEGPGTPPPAGQDAAGNNIDYDPFLTTSDLDGPCGADLTITKTQSSTFTPGQTGASQYTITVTNAGGGTATAPVTVTDTFPAGFTPTSATCQNTSNAQVATSCPASGPYTYPALAPGESFTILVNGTTTQTGPSTQSNTATVSGGGEVCTPPNGSAAICNNNSSTANAQVNGLPVLRIHKDHSPVNFRAPGFGIWSIDVFNAATAPSPTFGSIQVVDTFPVGVVPLFVGGPGWTCFPSGGTTWTCNSTLLALEGGQHSLITAIVFIRPAAPETLVNTATVGGGGLPNPPIAFKTTDTVHTTRWFHFF